MKRKSNHTARKTWIHHNGCIPKDSDGFSYEIHHTDGNPNNNDISNLQAISIKEHLQIHISQEDWFAAALIAKRIGHGPDYCSQLQRGKKRPGIGGAPRGRAPWNKGIKSCFNDSTIERMKASRKGRRFGRLKISDADCLEIIGLYNSRPDVPGALVKSKNGRVVSYETAFAKHWCEMYAVTPNQIYNIITGKRNVIE